MQAQSDEISGAPSTAGPRAGLCDFHNRLRILVSLDRHELIEAGVLQEDDAAGWLRFRGDPNRWFIRAGDEEAEKLWALMNRRSRRAGYDDLRQALSDILDVSERMNPDQSFNAQGRLARCAEHAREAIAKAEAR